MSVSLEKPDKTAKISLEKPKPDNAPVREYTPVHIIDESETIKASSRKPKPGASMNTEQSLEIAEAETTEKYPRENLDTQKHVSKRGFRFSDDMIAGLVQCVFGALMIAVMCMLRDHEGLAIERQIPMFRDVTCNLLAMCAAALILTGITRIAIPFIRCK